MVSQDMVRQINKLSSFPEGEVSLHTPTSPVPLLICSPTAYLVPAEETFLLICLTEMEEYKPSKILDIFLPFIVSYIISLKGLTGARGNTNG